MTDESLKALRRGWYLGEQSFGQKVLSMLDGRVSAKRRKGSIRGEAARAHDAAEAERVAVAGIELLGLPAKVAELRGRGKWLIEKSLVAALIRKRTGVRNAWVAERLGMGHEANVTVALRRVRESGDLTRKLARLQRRLEKNG